MSFYNINIYFSDTNFESPGNSLSNNLKNMTLRLTLVELPRKYLVTPLFHNQRVMIPLIILQKVSSKIYDKRDNFDFDIVNFPFLDGDVPRRASYGLYISQLIRFARVCNHVTDFRSK